MDEKYSTHQKNSSLQNIIAGEQLDQNQAVKNYEMSPQALNNKKSDIGSNNSVSISADVSQNNIKKWINTIGTSLQNLRKQIDEFQAQAKNNQVLNMTNFQKVRRNIKQIQDSYIKISQQLQAIKDVPVFTLTDLSQTSKQLSNDLHHSNHTIKNLRAKSVQNDNLQIKQKKNAFIQGDGVLSTGEKKVEKGCSSDQNQEEQDVSSFMQSSMILQQDRCDKNQFDDLIQVKMISKSQKSQQFQKNQKQKNQFTLSFGYTSDYSEVEQMMKQNFDYNYNQLLEEDQERNKQQICRLQKPHQ